MSQAAQNQHYVPKFILRNFLADRAKERVSVFRKATRTGFTTSINNIMAERRFHDFAIDEGYLASFEAAMGSVEEVVLPTYRRVIQTRCLTNDPMEKAALSILLAFQLLRTRQQRDQLRGVEQLIGWHLAKHGGRLEDLGYGRLDEDQLKLQHLELMRSAMIEYAQVIAEKDFLLLSAAPGRAFYLSDNPVCLHNSETADPLFGNIGLAVEGIEIYMPLSSELMLAAYCPSILRGLVRNIEDHERRAAAMALGAVADGLISAEQMRAHVEHIREILTGPRNLIDAQASGTPLQMLDTNMDFSNSLQLAYAREFVICAHGNFDLARRVVEESPGRQGHMLEQ